MSVRPSRGGRECSEWLELAAHASLVVLPYDYDFDRIADVTGQLTEWIVGAGLGGELVDGGVVDDAASSG
jgi:hypothetical protein